MELKYVNYNSKETLFLRCTKNMFKIGNLCIP